MNNQKTIMRSLSLYDFKVVEGNLSEAQVVQELGVLLHTAQAHGQAAINKNFNKALQECLTTDVMQKYSSKNRLVDKLEVTSRPSVRQGYNVREMINNEIGSMLAGFVQKHKLLALMQANKAPDYKDVQVKLVQRSLDNGSFYSLPTMPLKLNFGATDPNCCKISRSKKHIHFTLRFLSENVTLRFNIPKRVQRENIEKITKPTIEYDSKNRLVFRFSKQLSVREQATTRVMGVDIGKHKYYSSVIIDPIENVMSQEYTEPRNVRNLTHKITTLYTHKNRIAHKLTIPYHENNQVLSREKTRISNKITRLKRERATLAALAIVRIAKLNDASVSIEELNWAPSGAWDRKIQHDTLINTAQKQGVPVKKVSAKNTSRECWCGAKLTHRKRKVYCKQCDSLKDRDYNAAGNTAARAINEKNLHLFKRVLMRRKNRRYPTRGAKPISSLPIGTCSVVLNGIIPMVNNVSIGHIT